MPAQYAANPWIPAATNLSALFAGPDALREAQAMLAASGVNENNAQADKYTAEAAGVRAQNDAFGQLGGQMGALIQDPRLAGLATLFMQAGRGNAEQLTSALNQFRGGAMVVPGAGADQIRMGATLMGNNPGLTDAFTTGEITNANTADYNKAMDERRLQNQSALDVQRLENEGAAARNSADNAAAMARLEAELAWRRANPHLVRGGKGPGDPLDISPAEATSLRDLLVLGFPKETKIPPDVMASMTTEAGQAYQNSRNAATAASNTIGNYEMVEGEDPTELLSPSTWFDVPQSTVQRRPGAPAPGAPTAAGPTLPEILAGISGQAPPSVPMRPNAVPAAPAPAPAANSPEALIAEANAAIQRGADPAKVRARLQQMGIQLAP